MIMARMATEKISAADFMPDDFEIRQIARREGTTRFWYQALVIDRHGDRWSVVHNRWGSWLVDADDGMMAEPEKWFGDERGRRVKWAMVKRCSAIERKINDALGKTKPSG